MWEDQAWRGRQRRRGGIRLPNERAGSKFDAQAAPVLHTAGALRRSPGCTDSHGHNAAFLAARNELYETGIVQCNDPKTRVGLPEFHPKRLSELRLLAIDGPTPVRYERLLITRRPFDSTERLRLADSLNCPRRETIIFDGPRPSRMGDRGNFCQCVADQLERAHRSRQQPLGPHHQSRWAAQAGGSSANIPSGQTDVLKVPLTTRSTIA
jgi:hypothetical protein